ncbi:hypothetical protein [Microbulbifer epialgicus]|uniref:Uncharacterized protein n=1 Tax=Microbulbifer epialgicus TaxID=393907 RepID=A0ABV4NUV6_9GAMM
MENQSTSFTKSFLKDVVNSIHSFLYNGERKKFKNIKDAAKGMKSVWEQLEFGLEDPVDKEWQEVGLGVLDRIIKGELVGFSAEEHLHGVNGMFNQTATCATNAI